LLIKHHFIERGVISLQMYNFLVLLKQISANLELGAKLVSILNMRSSQMNGINDRSCVFH